MKRMNNTESGKTEERTRKTARGGKAGKKVWRKGGKGNLDMDQLKSLTKALTFICGFELSFSTKKPGINNFISENTSFGI